MDIDALQIKIAQFAENRDWDQFHSPKNLSMALSVEAAELLEIFQWLTSEESTSLTPEQHQEASEELADILIYLLRIAQKLDINLEEAV